VIKNTPSSNKKDPDSLSNRALLTFISQILTQATGIIAGLIFTPIIIRGLGAEMYGAWSMIRKSTGFIGFTNLNAMGIIKLLLGVRQHDDNTSKKRRFIGACIIQWFALLPLMICIVCILAYFSPQIIPTHQKYESIIRWTFVIMAASVPLQQLLSLPSGVLAGQNLAYKAMGLNAFMVLFGSSINVAGILLGFGILTLAVTTIISMLLSSLVQLYIVKKNVPWFGIEKPRRREFYDSLGISMLGSFTTLAGMFLTAADTIVLGMVFGPTTAAVYVTTGALIRFLSMSIQQLLRSGNAGIMYLGGKKEWNKIAKLRIELYQIAFMCFTTIGIIIIIFNESFLKLWVGGNYYGGDHLTVALIVLTIVRQFVLTDAIPLDAVLQLKPKLIVMLFFGTISIPFGYFLSKHIGPVGYPTALIFSYINILICFQFLIKKYNNIPIINHCKKTIRALTLCFLFLSITTIEQHNTIFNATHWLELILKAGTIGIIVGTAFFFIGVSYEIRVSVLRKCNIFFTRMSKRWV